MKNTLKELLVGVIATGMLLALILGLTQIFGSPIIALEVFVLSFIAFAWLTGLTKPKKPVDSP